MGLLVVFEGADGAGKSTQAAILAKAGEATLMSFPDRTTTIGRMLDACLKGAEKLSPEALHLLFAANRRECEQKLRENLVTGSVVVDRYCYSGTAYSMARGLERHWCESTDYGMPRAGVVFYLTTRKASEREGYGEEVTDMEDFQNKVKLAYEEIRRPDWIEIDGDLPAEEVTRRINHALKRRADECPPPKVIGAEPNYANVAIGCLFGAMIVGLALYTM